MHQWTRSSSVQITACCLFSANPLYKPMINYCQLDCKQHISEIYIEMEASLFKEIQSKMWSAKCQPFSSDLNVIKSHWFSYECSPYFGIQPEPYRICHPDSHVKTPHTDTQSICSSHGNTVECRYDAVQFFTILRMALQWQWQNVKTGQWVPEHYINCLLGHIISL